MAGWCCETAGAAGGADRGARTTREEGERDVLRDDGALVMMPFTEARPMGAGMSRAEMKASEITYSYDGPCGGQLLGR